MFVVILRGVREIANSDMTKLRRVCPRGSTRLRLDGFSWNLRVLRTYVQKSKVSLKSDTNNQYCYLGSVSSPLCVCVNLAKGM